MQKIVEDNCILLTGVKHFCPQATLECGQVFRFRVSEGGYTLIAKDKKCAITRKNDGIVAIETTTVDFFDNYFDLLTDYSLIASGVSEFAEFREQVAYGRGIRILRQDLFETIISFIISSYNNIPRIKLIIERICKEAGERIDQEDYAFPTPEALSTLSADDFRRLGAGHRDKNLYATAQEIANTDILIRIEDAKDDYAKCCKLLCSLKGVGPKVANCVALFGLGLTSCFPVDVHVFRGLMTDTLDTPDKVMKHYQSRLGNLAGYAQQYLFYHQRGKAKG